MHSIFSFLFLISSIGNNANHIDVLIVGELTKLSSYYTGRWVSQYTIGYFDDSIKVLYSIG